MTNVTIMAEGVIGKVSARKYGTVGHTYAVIYNDGTEDGEYIAKFDKRERAVEYIEKMGWTWDEM